MTLIRESRLAGEGSKASPAAATVPPFVILHDQVDGRSVRHRQTRRFLGRDVETDRAVGLLEIGFRHAVDVGRRHGGDAIALDEQQPPVAVARRRTQGLCHRLAVRLEHLGVPLAADFRLVHFVVGERHVAERFERFHQGVAHRVERFRRAGRRSEKEAGIVRVIRAGGRAGGQLRFDQGLVKPAVGRLRDDAAQQTQRCPVGVRGRRDVIRHARRADRANPAQRDRAFAVLRRFLGVGGIELARRFRDRAEVFFHEGEGLRLLELAGHDQHDVIRLIILLVKGLQVVDGHAFDVGPAADGGLAVVVPFVGRGVDPLVEDGAGVVLAAFELVADDRHFRQQILALDEAVDETIAFESDAELEVLVGGGHGLEVVGAVAIRGAVEAGPVIAKRLGHLRVVGRALEDHVFEQVSHAGFAVAFVAAADEHGHVHGHRRPRRLGKEQHPCPVGKPVLRHALDRGDLDGLRHRGSPPTKIQPNTSN